MEMRSTCNLVDVQMMHGIYIMIDVQMLIITYILFMVCYDIHCTCTMLWCILHGCCDNDPLVASCMSSYLVPSLVVLPAHLAKHMLPLAGA